MASGNLNFNMPLEAGGDGSGGGLPWGNFALPRQSSVYSLTFDEFQNTVGSMGKDFGSMNMDELLRNIWSAEENQNTGITSNGINNVNGVGQETSRYLQRQCSLTLPRTLSQKTVDQVWRDMVKEYEGGKDPTCAATFGFGVVPQHRQPTLGEVTLEEFLVRAGVVKEEIQLAEEAKNVDLFENLAGPANNFGGCNSGNLALNVNGARSPAQQQAVQQVHPHQHQQQLLPEQPTLTYPSSNQLSYLGIRGGTKGILDPVMSDDIMVQNVMVGLGGNNGVSVRRSPGVSSDGLTKSNGDTSSVSPVPCVFNGGGGGGLRGRKNSGFEKVVERRQRRMIKNRESAARSRARKQAYTEELEAEVAKLKEENKLLQKKQADMLEMERNQVLEMMKQQNVDKRVCLRRTQTGPW